MPFDGGGALNVVETKLVTVVGFRIIVNGGVSVLDVVEVDFIF